MKNNSKPSHLESTTHIKNEVPSTVNINFTDKLFRHVNPDFEQVGKLVKIATDDCA